MYKQTINKASGFSLIELVIVIVVVAIALPFVMQGLYEGVRAIILPPQVDRPFLLASEQLEVIRNSGYWIDDIDTQVPQFPGNPYDLAESWKSRLDADNRSFSSAVNGKVEVTYLKGAALAPFSGAQFDGNEKREKRKIRITVTLDGKTGVIDTYQMTYPTEARLLAILRRIKLALLQYQYNNAGSYPLSLSSLVPTYLPELPNNPYTITQAKVTHLEEILDYSFSNVSGIRTLLANSHPTATYPSLTLIW